MNFAFNTLKTKLKKIREIPWMLASRAFLIMVFFILITFLIGGFLFYQYMILAKTQPPNTAKNNTTFEYATYKEILNQWQINDQKLQASKDIQYLNPFIP